MWRQRNELSKQLQDHNTDVTLHSVTNLKPHDRYFIPNYNSYCFLGIKSRELQLLLEQAFNHINVDLPPVVAASYHHNNNNILHHGVSN
jgi:hypothetical protein